MALSSPGSPSSTAETSKVTRRLPPSSPERAKLHPICDRRVTRTRDQHEELEVTNVNAKRHGSAGIWVPAHISSDPSLSVSEKFLLSQIESLARGPCGCVAGNAYLARLLGIGVRQLKRYLARLKTLGLIRSESLGRGRRRLYMMNSESGNCDGPDDTSPSQLRPPNACRKRPPLMNWRSVDLDQRKHRGVLVRSLRKRPTRGG